jgi:hypothetical protein
MDHSHIYLELDIMKIFKHTHTHSSKAYVVDLENAKTKGT